jgi:hypothetical protein
MSPQASLVLDYLRTGRKLTPLIAHVTLGIASLTSRIAELRRHVTETGEGTIEGVWDVDGFNRRYMVYRLVKEPTDAQ